MISVIIENAKSAKIASDGISHHNAILRLGRAMNPLTTDVKMDAAETAKDMKLVIICDSLTSNRNPELWMPVIKATKATINNTMAAMNVQSDRHSDNGQPSLLVDSGLSAFRGCDISNISEIFLGIDYFWFFRRIIKNESSEISLAMWMNVGILKSYIQPSSLRGKKVSVIVEIIEMIIKVITAMVACFNFMICLLGKKPDSRKLCFMEN